MEVSVPGEEGTRDRVAVDESYRLNRVWWRGRQNCLGLIGHCKNCSHYHEWDRQHIRSFLYRSDLIWLTFSKDPSGCSFETRLSSLDLPQPYPMGAKFWVSGHAFCMLSFSLRVYAPHSIAVVNTGQGSNASKLQSHSISTAFVFLHPLDSLSLSRSWCINLLLRWHVQSC